MDTGIALIFVLWRWSHYAKDLPWAIFSIVTLLSTPVTPSDGCWYCSSGMSRLSGFVPANRSEGLSRVCGVGRVGVRSCQGRPSGSSASGSDWAPGLVAHVQLALSGYCQVLLRHGDAALAPRDEIGS